MALNAGSKLGPYEVVSLLGTGGMGEVYRARDTRLGRVVAIKVLPAERMADENRRRRFVQEARAASALNHPNIVTIYEIESADGIDFIVMEYVEGKTLDALIPRLGMKLGDALRVVIPIADALARAHAAGIVHRDLKPANVAVSDSGMVKVLDFGLAKLVSAETRGPENETVSEDPDAGPLSRPGRVTGTAGYMSPEQATGTEVDARSDVFGFGAVLYEMLTGRRAFAGTSTAETLAAVVRDQPKALSEVVPTLPKELERLIQRCLRKEPERRFQHMLDVKLELEQIKEESESGRSAATQVARRKGLRWFGTGLALALVLATPTWLWLRLRLREVPLDPPRLEPLTSMPGDEDDPTLSPDGEQVAFMWNGEKGDKPGIYLKVIGSSEVRRLTTYPDAALNWSPDGRLIAFLRHGPDGVARIHLVSPVTGAERKLGEFPPEFWFSWSPDSRWLAAVVDHSPKKTETVPAGTASFYLLPVDGGEPRPIRIPQEPSEIYAPSFSPDGRHLAYFSNVTAAVRISLVDLGPDYMPTAPPRRMTQRPVWAMDRPVWTRDGKSILYADWGINRLWRVEVTGDRAPEPVEIAGLRAMRPTIALRRDRLVFAKAQGQKSIYRFEVGQPDEPVITSSFLDAEPQFSPDGRRVAFTSLRSGDCEIWIAGADGSSPTQLTHGQGRWNGTPRWSPDGRQVAFNAQRDDGTWDIWTIDADGGSPRRLTQDPGDENCSGWSRDGRFIYFATQRQGSTHSGPDVWRIPVAGGTEERITQDGGGPSQESVDGNTLFFVRAFGPSPLLARPLAGGPERELAKCVSAFAVVPAGLYYLECSDGPEKPLFVRDPATGRRRLLGKLDGSCGAGDLTVSPDGKTILYTRAVGGGSDLMMVDNFR